VNQEKPLNRQAVIHLYMPPETRKQLKLAATEAGESMQDFILSAALAAALQQKISQRKVNQ